MQQDTNAMQCMVPVQYAAPREKKTEISDPISPLHFSKSSLLAGRPKRSFAAHRLVAALPLPPPKPAPADKQLHADILATLGKFRISGNPGRRCLPGRVVVGLLLPPMPTGYLQQYRFW